MGGVAVLRLAWHSGVSFGCLQYLHFFSDFYIIFHANYVNKPKNVFYMIICNGPCDSRLNGAVNVIALLT